MRSLYKLYGIVIENFDKRIDMNDNGICALINYISIYDYINMNEKAKLKKHFLANKPFIGGKYHDFAKHKMFYDGLWWWKFGEESKEQRLLFLKALQNDVQKPIIIKIWHYFTKRF